MVERAIEPSRLARGTSADDIVLPFGTVKSRVSGRIVRLGPAVDSVLAAHGQRRRHRQCHGRFQPKLSSKPVLCIRPQHGLRSGERGERYRECVYRRA